MMKSVFIGCGAYLPRNCVSNDELSKRVDTSDDWIVARTGISNRYIAADDELTSDLAYNAAVEALASAGIIAEDLDLIVLATATPDETFPATATTVQARLGAVGIPAFDVQAVCSGFIYALAVADNFIKAEQAKIFTNEPTIVHMNSMHVTITLKSGEIVVITSDTGRYDKINYDIFFEGNVKAVHKDTELLSDNLKETLTC